MALTLSLASFLCAFPAPVALPLAAWQWIKAFRTRNGILEREGSVYPALIAAPILGLLGLGMFTLMVIGMVASR